MSIRSAVGLTAAVTLWLTLAALASMPERHDSGAAFLPVSHEANRSFRPGTARPEAMPAAIATADDKADPKKDEVKLTLDRIFPEKSFFGPSASRVSFSHDGRFAAFLYRSFVERRHGSDLYVHDSETGQIRRITSVGRMAEHQADVREVRDDREKQAKKAGITLRTLADEQAARLGWPASSPLGTWKGDATTEGGPIDEGQATLHLARSKKDSFEGYVRIGLVKLALTDAKFDSETSTLTATIDDKTLSVKGSFEATAGEDFGSLSGTLTLEEPAQTVAFTVAPSDETKPDDDSPKGVIGAIGERLTLGDVVTDADAEINDEKNGKAPDKRAPRYGGVQGFEWSESSNEMLLLSGGDIYRLRFDADKWAAPTSPPDPADKDAKGKPVTPYRGDLERLTFTRERESDVQYLPDGSGYTYLRDGALLRVSFGDHRIVQLDPELKDGERMVGYRISPDQKRLVFLANRGDSYWGRGTSVTIVNYRERFARANQVTRHMPDSPWPDAFTSVYLYDLDGYETEEGTLERVFTKRLTGPRDILRMPEWSPDSARIAFAAYEQSTGLVNVLEAGFVEENADEDKKADAQKEDASEDTDDADKDDENKDDGDNDDTESDRDSKADATEPEKDEDKPEFEIENAKVVYEFYHFGGPNTPGMIEPQYLPDSRRMAFITELSGFRQLHLLDPRYQQLTQLTYGQFEVYPFDISDDNSTIFATATKDDPNQGHVYAINLESGAMTKLTSVDGDYSSVAVRDDGSLLLASHIDFGSPRELVAVTPADGATTPLTDSHPKEAHVLTTASPEYFTYENRHGQTIHGHMFKPKDFSPEDKRPLLIYVYGGPLGERKMATRGAFAAPSYFFARYMAEVHGYVTATIDPRGASGYGAVFEKANFEQVGKPQTEDLVDGARWLVKQGGIDEKKMGLHGWSFGGFQTQMVMYTEPDVFAVGMAGAGPTEWFNYNSWYTTGTIGPHKPGQLNLKDQSLLPLAKNIKGRLLLVHGMEDSNVLYQDTVNVYRELLKADKEVNVELFLDPTGGHGLGGDVKTIGRYRKYEDFLLRYLGKGEPAKSDAPAKSNDAEAPADEAVDEAADEGATADDAGADSTGETDEGDSDDGNEDEQESDDGAEGLQDAVNSLRTQTANP